MKTAILSLVLLLLASCQDNKKEQLLHLVKEWQGKEIRFPEKPVFTRFVTDTTDYRIPVAAGYKVVVYVDSIGCVSCKLQFTEMERVHRPSGFCHGWECPLPVLFPIERQ